MSTDKETDRYTVLRFSTDPTCRRDAPPVAGTQDYWWAGGRVVYFFPTAPEAGVYLCLINQRENLQLARPDFGNAFDVLGEPPLVTYAVHYTPLVIGLPSAPPLPPGPQGEGVWATEGSSGTAHCSGREGGVWHKASVSDCLPLAAPIGLSPLLILTLRGPERVFVVSTEPPDDLSCLTTPGVGCPADGLLPVPLTRGIQMHTPSPCGGLPTPALTERGGGDGACLHSPPPPPSLARGAAARAPTRAARGGGPMTAAGPSPRCQSQTTQRSSQRLSKSPFGLGAACLCAGGCGL